MEYSVLFPRGKAISETDELTGAEKNYLRDLGLDLIFEPLLKGKKEYEIDDYFYHAVHDLETIQYRQDVMKDLENPELKKLIVQFSQEVYFIRLSMNRIRKDLASPEPWNNNHLTRGHMLELAQRYAEGIINLYEQLDPLLCHSKGLKEFSDYLEAYVTSEPFEKLRLEILTLRKEFSHVEYTMLISSGTIKVRKYEGEKDYSKQIIAMFEKFRQGKVKDYRQNLQERPVADHVEAAVLNLLAKTYKEEFIHLSDFADAHRMFDDDSIIRFSKEVQFYLAWLELISPLKQLKLPFHYPCLQQGLTDTHGEDGFDLALALKIKEQTIKNSFTLKKPERILVITGPNQGGKTTFAKMIGQMHHLAYLGVCVPGESSCLDLFDQIYTHFGRQEDLSTQSGKLKDDLLRLHDILTVATERSLIIINEIFTSTTLSDAVGLGERMIAHLLKLQSMAVIVTFLDELALQGEQVVSMMSTVNPDDPAQRTFKVLRKPPDGLAYALHIARKFGLTYEQLSRRIKE